MTGQRAAKAAPRKPNGRRAQLEAMQALQRRLNEIKPCECPEDCRAQGRDSTPERENNNNDNSQNETENPSSDNSQNETENPSSDNSQNETENPSSDNSQNETENPSSDNSQNETGNLSSNQGGSSGSNEGGPANDASATSSSGDPTDTSSGNPPPLPSHLFSSDHPHSGPPKDPSTNPPDKKTGTNSGNTVGGTTGTNAGGDGPRIDIFGISPSNPLNDDPFDTGDLAGFKPGDPLPLGGTPRDNIFSISPSNPLNADTSGSNTSSNTGNVTGSQTGGASRDDIFSTSQSNPLNDDPFNTGDLTGFQPGDPLPLGGGPRDNMFSTSSSNPLNATTPSSASDAGSDTGDTTGFKPGDPLPLGGAPRDSMFSTPQSTRVVSGSPGGTSWPGYASAPPHSHRGGGGYLPGQVSRRARARTRSKVLARARAAKPIDLERTGDKGRLRMSLQVHADPQDHRTRLGYYADLFLKLEEPEKNGGPEEEHHVGYISTWRLSKEPNQYSHEELQPWVTEWLQDDSGSLDDDSRPFKETLRLLYDKTGQLRSVDDDSLRSALSDTGSDLVFVEMIWIKYKDEKTGFLYSSQRIAAHALELLYSLMNNGTLPAWYSINLPVTFVLRPGMPSDDGLSEMWLKERPKTSDETDQQYAQRIARIVKDVFQIEDRYGFIGISNDHSVLALTVAFPNRERVVGSVLEDETDPALDPAQPAPQPVLSSIRC